MAPAPFVSDPPSVRVVFGPGTFGRLHDEVRRLGAARALVLSTPVQRDLAEEAAGNLGTLAAGVHTGAVMHVPVEVAQAGYAAARRHSADLLVAIGGGSTVGLAKAIALETGLPILAVPTTYAGSEMTPIYGLTEAQAKRTGRDARVLPKTALYDPNLTLGLPSSLSATSGLNAVAHCLEGLYAEDATPVTTLMAAEGMRALARALPVVITAPRDLEARTEALYGAWLAGSVLGQTAVGIHHKLCHTLGGAFNLPHADTHAVILPHAAAYNRDAAPEAMRIAAAALGGRDVPAALSDLAARVGAPRTLRDLGMEERDLDRAAKLATENPYRNPRPVEYAGVRQLLDNAFHGRHP